MAKKKEIKIIKALSRSKKNRMIAGICSGIAEFLEIDPTLVRLLWAVLTVITAVVPGIIVYIIAWIIIPEEK